MITRASSRPFVFLAATPFDTCLSGRTRRLAERLAARGHDVTFVERPDRRSLLRGAFQSRGRCDAPSTVRVLRPPFRPGRGWGSIGGLERVWRRRTNGVLARTVPDLQHAVVIASTPWWSPLIDGLACGAFAYDCIDHLSVHAGPGGLDRFAREEADLLARADFVTTVSLPLRDALTPRFDPERIFLVPNGVSSDWFDAPVEAVPRSNLTDHADRPLGGFVGSLFEWIDVDLLAATARALPHVAFVLIGPRRRGVRLDALTALPNLRLLPPVPYAQVPGVIGAFDVCLIPFKQDAISRCADPLKRYEYCASGKPVVSSVSFCSDGAPDPIIAAETRAAFIAAIESAIADDTPARQADRIAYGRRHTWQVRADALLAAVDAVLSRDA